MTNPTQARIIRLHTLAPDVVEVVLAAEDTNWSFRPGQWLDFQVPGLDKVGGFTITSTPARLAQKGEFTLAVKKSRCPLTQWLHDRARPGDRVHANVGGTFVYHAQRHGGPLLLIAGGIGITPLIAIFRYVRESEPEKPVTLLHSAKRVQDLVFRDEILMAAMEPHIEAYFTLTAENWDGPMGRLSAAAIAEKTAFAERTHVFICGPEKMQIHLAQACQQTGIPSAQIYREQWG